MASSELVIIVFLVIAGVIIIFGPGIAMLVERRKRSQNKQFETRPELTKDQPVAVDPKSASRKEIGSTNNKKRYPVHREFNVFISYRRNDSADVTGRIYDRLTQHFGQSSIFKDVDAIPLGVDFRVHLDQAVGKCSVLIAVIGNRWLTAMDAKGSRRLNDPRDFVRIEIEAALNRKIPVIPVLVQGTSMPSSEELPASLNELAYRNGIPIRPDPDFHKDMDRLIRGIESLI